MPAHLDHILARTVERLAHDLTSTRQTNVSRFRDGLQVAMDALGDDEKAREFRRILTSLHWLAGADKPSMQLSHVDQIAESVEWLRNWHDGPDEDGPGNGGTGEQDVGEDLGGHRRCHQEN